jgi:hypothetical protein
MSGPKVIDAKPQRAQMLSELNFGSEFASKQGRPDLPWTFHARQTPEPK